MTNKRHSTEVALIFVKMASVMGVTWILGIVANVQALSFLWYPYIVLNSLQGIVLLFVLFPSFFVPFLLILTCHSYTSTIGFWVRTHAALTMHMAHAKGKSLFIFFPY